MERPVFILGSHKSGTSLVRSLLQGVPDLFVVPLETHFFQFTGFWVDYALRRSHPRHLTFEEALTRIQAHLQRSNTITSMTSDSKLVGRWDLIAFTSWLQKKGRDRFAMGDWRGFFDAYIEALHVGLFGQPPDTARFVEKSVEHAEFAGLLKQLYPDATFVHIIRNPYATLVSLRRHMSIAGYPMLGPALSALNNSYYFLYHNPQIVSDYLVIRYEDLLQQPTKVMRRIAEHIDIPFTSQLLIPTSLNGLWTGNSSSGQVFEGISTQPITAWRKHIQALETAFINLLFPHVLRDFGYERYPVLGSIYRPAPGEQIKTYIKNRWLWLLTSRSGVLPS